MPEPIPTPARPARRVLVLSLRVLMLLIALIAVWLGWITNRARRQAEVVRELQARNALFVFDYEIAGHPTSAELRRRKQGPPPGPAWLRRFVGDEYFRKLASVSWKPDLTIVPRKLDASLHGPRPDDDLVRKLASLSGIEFLSVWRSEVSAEGLANVSRMTDLTALKVFRSPNVTDASFAHVRSLGKLEQFVTEDCRIGDRTLAYLAGSPKLKVLSVRGGIVTDAGLAHVRTMPSLEMLHVESPAINDAGLAHLRGLSNLKVLGVGSPLITDAGLANVATLGNLQGFTLREAQISDEGVAQLAKLKALSSLYLSISGPPLTDRALESIRALTELATLGIGSPQGTATHFTDAAMLELVKSLPRLRLLFLEPPNLDSKFVSQLQQARPGLRVLRVGR